MSDVSLPGGYNPAEIEKKWYTEWEARKYFGAEVKPGRPKYCITIPPPNVTGSLHIGHALCYSIQDVLTRWKRMQGFNTLCLPGTDHAGIATQNKVEQQIAEQGLTRHDLGREKFLKRVWEWKDEYGGQILRQFKTMGFSFDWDRERFTMDAGYTEAVQEAFIRLFNKGYIYRGARVINWCPRCHTAISDIEVEHIEEQGHLWHIRYPLEDGSGFVTVATTRPETMLGDTAVTVHPDDPRYTNLIGKNVKLPLTDRVLPIIADDFVDMEFGTGAVKATPAHDPNDFEIGLRHNLPQVVVIGIDGSMTAEAGEKYAGLDRYDARKAVLHDLEHLGLLVETTDHTHQVGTCERCHTVIEPLLSEQWFCKMKELAEPAIDAVKSGSVKFWPDRYERTYIDWMENVRDWCISRQLWWGHRIPVWKCDECGGYVAARSQVAACEKCGCTSLTQDPDVLDTWFSSALWPFATLGWPKDTPELAYFYPTDVLVTAQEILYLWVARMIFSSCEYLDGQIPFKDVYIYATVLNEEGRRMSKSLGTGVDPLDLIEKHGADALRFSLIQQAGKNQDLRFSDKRVENAARFANKIWNASKFVLMNLTDYNPTARVDPGDLTLEDRWILSRLSKTADAVNSGFTTYDMDYAARALYEFIWNEFCDWYVELVKPRLRGEPKDKVVAQWVLHHVLDTILRLLHPIMPFITEEIWQAIPHQGRSIMLAQFPDESAGLVDEEAEAQLATLMETIRNIRNLRAELGVEPAKRVNVTLVADKPTKKFLERCSESLRGLGRIEILTFADSIPEEAKANFKTASAVGVDVNLEIAGALDTAKELEKIAIELKSIAKELERTGGKLNSPQFIERAPAEIVEKERRILAELEEKQTKLQERAKLLEG